MCSYFAVVQVTKGKTQRLTLATVESSMLSASREKLIVQALRGGATHALFLDSDMDFPIDTAHRLLKWDKEFICAAYPTRSEPAVPVAAGLDGKKFSSKGKHGIQKIQHGGFGVCLIYVDAVKKLQQPLFLMDWIPDVGGGSYCGEDVYFSQKMAQVGIELWVDHDLSNEIGHVGYKRFDFEDVTTEELIKHNDTLA
jgi:hypothetical protein